MSAADTEIQYSDMMHPPFNVSDIHIGDIVILRGGRSTWWVVRVGRRKITVRLLGSNSAVEAPRIVLKSEVTAYFHQDYRTEARWINEPQKFTDDPKKPEFDWNDIRVGDMVTWQLPGVWWVVGIDGRSFRLRSIDSEGISSTFQADQSSLFAYYHPSASSDAHWVNRYRRKVGCEITPMSVEALKKRIEVLQKRLDEQVACLSNDEPGVEFLKEPSRVPSTNATLKEIEDAVAKTGRAGESFWPRAATGSANISLSEIYKADKRESKNPLADTISDLRKRVMELEGKLAESMSGMSVGVRRPAHKIIDPKPTGVGSPEARIDAPLFKMGEKVGRYGDPQEMEFGGMYKGERAWCRYTDKVGLPAICITPQTNLYRV